MRNINGLIAFCTLTLLIGSCKKDTEQVTPINNNTVLTGDSILYRIKKNSILRNFRLFALLYIIFS